MTYHNCNLRGVCEANSYSGYPSREACQANCSNVNLDPQEREMAFITLSYDPELSLTLAPSDQVQYLRREYGITVSVEEATQIASALYSNDYLGLYRVGMDEYLKSEAKRVPPRELDALDYMMLRVIAPYQAIEILNWDYYKAVMVLYCSSSGMSSTFGPSNELANKLASLQTAIILEGHRIAGKISPPPGRFQDFMWNFTDYLWERFG